MGSIYRKVTVCAIGKPEKCKTVKAFIDSGATVSVVSRRLAKELGAEVRKSVETLETADGKLRSFDAADMELRLQEKGCPTVRRSGVVVSDDLAAKAGGSADMILGTDYLQRARVGLLFGPRESDHVVACAAPRRRNGSR